MSNNAASTRQALIRLNYYESGGARPEDRIREMLIKSYLPCL